MVTEEFDRWEKGCPLLWEGFHYCIHQKNLIYHYFLVNPLTRPLMLRRIPKSSSVVSQITKVRPVAQ